ncbi:diaminopropionate ammonia-lyase [Candidatus Dojkabacteria bacterium]|nr:diaminopropionate ammonia-lyase [Candidatus Dojkabacteria bacterium]
MKDTIIHWLKNENSRKSGNYVHDFLTVEISDQVRNFHQKLEGFKQTPLLHLSDLSKELGVGGVWVKDEGKRNELKSFKALGGSWAIFQHLKKCLGIPEDREIGFDELGRLLKEKNKDIVFCTATDGNHGAGVAWAAQKLNQKAKIYFPQETVKARLDRVRSLGADVIVVPDNYDIAVEKAFSDAKENGWTIISDTAWEGYEEIPKWVIQGYTTLTNEAQEQLNKKGIDKPTHIFIQAGVGSLASGVVGYYSSLLKEEMPITVIVEPENADCIFSSLEQKDGKIHQIGGDLQTIMAGLSCGRPNPIAYEVLWNLGDYSVRCSDFVAAKGMRIAAAPAGNDPSFIAGESAVVGLGLLSFIQKSEQLQDLKKELQLNKDSQVLIISTEGDTDPVNYQHVVWDGVYPTPKKYLNY